MRWRCGVVGVLAVGERCRHAKDGVCKGRKEERRLARSSAWSHAALQHAKVLVMDKEQASKFTFLNGCAGMEFFCYHGDSIGKRWLVMASRRPLHCHQRPEEERWGQRWFHSIFLFFASFFFLNLIKECLYLCSP